MAYLIPLLILATALLLAPLYSPIFSTLLFTPSDPLQVLVRNGTLHGLHSPTYNQDFFLGIPYAQPPVDLLRFRVPQTINTTYPDGHRDATQYGKSCVGYGSNSVHLDVDEDCLVLNVVRPSGRTGGKKLPVAVWIYGGGFWGGGSEDPRYNMSFVVQNGVDMGKPFIGVSLNYRLGVWGFLSSEEVLGSGNANLGLRDQRLALHWIRENIAAFGGDPDQVTIWGESAGAMSVGFQMSAYNGRDDKLFRAAILQSGSIVNYNTFRDVRHYQPLYDSIVQAVHCETSADTLDCLRHRTYTELNAFFNATPPTAFYPPTLAFFPILDGDFLQRWGSIQLAEDAVSHVPILTGATSDEGTAWGIPGLNTDADLARAATSHESQAFLPPSFAPGVLEAYPDHCDSYIPAADRLPCDRKASTDMYPKEPYGLQYRRSAGYCGDAVMHANRRGVCEAWARRGRKAWSFRFHTLPAPGVLPESMAVTHGVEVVYPFDQRDGRGHGEVNPLAEEGVAGGSDHHLRLAKVMSKAWVSFIVDLDPNYKEDWPEDVPRWPEYDLERPKNMVWEANETGIAWVEDDTYRKEGIRFILDNNIAYHR